MATLRRYIASLAATLLILGLRFVAGRYWGSSLPLITLYPAVILAAWLGGRGPGLLSCAVCTVAGEFLDIVPTYSLSFMQYGNFAARALFFAIGAMMVFVMDAYAKAQARLRAVQAATERSAREAAESANRMKDEFLAMVSHDLRSPLQSILGGVSVLKKLGLPAEGDEFLAIIERSARTQSRLLEDLIDVSQISAGRLELDVHPESIRSLLEFAIKSMQTEFAEKGLRLEYSKKGPERTALIDQDRVQQIVTNLLSNALKFTPPGGMVLVDLDERNESHIELRVTDSGVGIDPNFLPDIFLPFRQGHSSMYRKGLGLGLAIVKNLVELHGGTIEAKSAGPGTGSTFTVALPLEGVHIASRICGSY